jgi:hypothetical protein
MDGSVLMLFGRDGGDSVIQKSTDNGQTWTHWRTLPSGVGEIIDWVIYDGATVYAACENGFYGTTRFGPAKQRLSGANYASIALQPGFNPNDPDNSVVLIGGGDGGADDGQALVSDDAGNTWGTAATVGSGDVFVAFDSNGTPYFATSESTVKTATISGNKLTKIANVKDSGGDSVDADNISGIYIAPDNALYVMAADTSTGSTTYTYDAEGTVDLSGTNAWAEGNVTVEQDIGFNPTEIISINTIPDNSILWTIADGAPFVNNELLDVVGTSFEVVSGAPTDLDGWMQVQGVTSGATGTVEDVQQALTGPFWFVGATCSVIDHLIIARVNEATIALTDEDISGVFMDGETLNIIDCDLLGNATGGVTGSITVQGATSLEEDSIAIDIATDLGFDLDEVVMCSSSTIDAEATGTAGSSTTNEALLRLLLDEPEPVDELGNVWEIKPISDATCLWGSNSFNTLWTVVSNYELWALEDSLSGPVQGVTVSSIGETKAIVSWAAVVGGEDASGDDNDITYQIVVLNGGEDVLTTTKTSMMLTGLLDNTDYTVHVRVAPQTDSVYSSRWSDAATFTTVEAIQQPTNLVPENGMQDAPLLPSFVWTEVSNAVEYEFQLSTDPAFGSLIVDTTTENTAYTCQTELAYDTNHYWRVRAVSATGTKSTWCFSNFHTRVEAIPPVTVEPPPTPTINLPAPQVTVIPPDVNVTLPPPQVTVVPPDVTVDVPPVVTVTQQPQPTLVLPEPEPEGTPVYIWVIVAIGAILTIAVIVLIIRTRRVV